MSGTPEPAPPAADPPGMEPVPLHEPRTVPESVADPGPTLTSVDEIQRLAPGAVLAGRFRVLALAGVGGMGMVYRAHDEQLGIEVALKVLRPEAAGQPSRVARFRSELLLGRQVSHRSVVRIHDLRRDGDLLFLVMDFVGGRTLSEVIEQQGPLAPEVAVPLARQIAEALGAAHAEGVVHRDLKPANVLVDETLGRAWVSDFGIARSLSVAGLTRPGGVVGTLDYLSPEQARGEEVDGRSDLYALGIVLFEMLAGRLPFPGGSDSEVLAQRLASTPSELSAVGVAAPAWLCKVLRRLLARDPARRYQSAAELVADLDRGAGDRPFRARLPLPPRRAALAGAGALALLALAAVAIHLLQERAVAAGAPRHTVAVLPLADDTGRADLAWAGRGMAEMLASTLAESPDLSVVDSLRVFRTVEDLKLPAWPLPTSEARRLASLLGVDRLVAGRLRPLGPGVRIDLALVAADLPDAAATSLSAEAADTAEVYRVAAALGAALRDRLAAEAPVEVPVALSASPAAAAAYVQGVEHLLRGDAVQAAPALERAVAADPSFAAAWVRLARARQSLGRRAGALDAVRRALDTLGEPGRGRRLALEARALEAQLAGDLERARQILAGVAERYPHDVEAKVALAETSGEAGDLEGAIAELDRVVAADPEHPRAWYLLGKYSIRAGDRRKALDEHLVRALVIQNKLGNLQGKADVLNAFGVAYLELGRLDLAAESYEDAAEIRRQIGDERGWAQTLRNLATIHTMRGEDAEAERRLREGLALLERVGDPAGLADLENDFGVLAEERGRYEEALEHYRRALAARRDLGDPLALAESFNNVGFASYLLGRYDDATVYWRRALELSQQSGDAAGVALATQSVGLLELARGDWDSALASFLSALESSRELQMKNATAVSLGNIGRAAALQGRYRAALASYGEALALLEELGDPRGRVEFTLAEAEALLKIGLLERADERLRASEALLGESPNAEQAAELHRLRGSSHLARGERESARGAFGRAIAEARASQSVVGLARARLGNAVAGRDLRELGAVNEEAEALGHAALRLESGEALAAEALARGDAAAAERAARTAVALARRCGTYGRAYRLHLLLARSLETQGRRADAIAELQLAAAEVERLRADLAADQRAAFDRLPEVREVAGRLEATA